MPLPFSAWQQVRRGCRGSSRPLPPDTFRRRTSWRSNGAEPVSGTGSTAVNRSWFRGQRIRSAHESPRKSAFAWRTTTSGVPGANRPSSKPACSTQQSGARGSSVLLATDRRRRRRRSSLPGSWFPASSEALVSTPPPTVCTSPLSMARGSTTACSHQAGRRTSTGCVIRPTTSQPSFTRGTTCSSFCWAMAGTGVA